MKKRRKIRFDSETIYQIICIILVTIFAICCIYPLIYSIGLSFVTQKEWSESNGMIFLFPKKPTIYAYEKVFSLGSYIFKAIGVSIVRTFLGTVGGVILAAILGYVLSIKDFPGKKIVTFFVLVTIFFAAGTIPNYVVVRDLGLLNTIWSLVLPGLLNTWYALIFKQFFEGIPEEVVESSRVDGASEFQIFIKIVMPMSKPVVASIAMFTLVAHWNSWYDAMIYIDSVHSSLWPLQYYVNITFSNMAQLTQSQLANWEQIMGTNKDVADIATKMALTVVSILPIIIIYPFFQKYFTKGVYMGSIK